MTALLTWIWQGLAIAAFTATVLACTPRLGAASRHAIWWMACAGVLGLPLAYILLAASVAGPAAPAAGAVVVVPPAPDLLIPALLVAWMAFAAVASIRIVSSVAAALRLKRAARPVDPLLADRLSRSRAAHLVARVRVSDRISGACALGLGSKMILLSHGLVNHLDDEALAAIVLHEQAHLNRHDDWWQLLQAVVGAVAGWHPAIWLIGRRIAIEREAACDDEALGRTSDARGYASALLRAAELRHTLTAFERTSAIPGAAVSASALRRRIVRMLDARIDRRARPALSMRVAASVAVALLVLAAARVPAVVAFEEIGAVLPGIGHAWTAGLATATASSPLAQGADLTAIRTGSSPASTPRAAASARPRIRTTTPPLQLASAPASPAGWSAPAAPVAATATLDPHLAAGTPLPSSPNPATIGSEPSSLAAPWISLGRSASRGGASIGRFFTRAAQGVAHRF